MTTFATTNKQANNATSSTRSTITGAYKGVFHYAANCEANFKRNFEYLQNPEELQPSTFTFDLSIAEYCEQEGGNPARITQDVEDTIQRSVTAWAHDAGYIIALLFAVNFKSHEHYAFFDERNAALRAFTPEVHRKYSEYYADRYYTLYNYVMDELFAGEENEETRARIWRTLD